jgi:acetyl-CoA synthetase
MHEIEAYIIILNIKVNFL